ncbi:MAG TPA: histidine kinase [Thermoanaerobaculia bacterium]|nr:histidine kinase [Thermoanaerobaculia bacterium]
MTTLDLSEPRRPRPVLRFLAGWTAVALLLGVVFKLQLPHVATLYAFINQAVETYTLALLSIVVWRVAERLHARRPPLMLFVTAHALLGIAVITAWQGSQMLFLRAVVGPNFWNIVYRESWGFQLITATLAYGTVLGVTLTLQSTRREREQERREAQLEIAAREAELTAMKAQFQPHFLFNSLNSVLALIDTDPPRAREMVLRLSELLQSTLRRIELDHVPLEREIELIRAYLDIEKIRFSARLGIDIDISREAGPVGVPPLILQPLVENAVKHGISSCPDGGEVRVAARVDGGRLRMEVSDTGRGSETGNGAGRGLELTRRRLEGTYGNDFRLDFQRRDGRFIVSLDVPAAGRHCG